MLADELDFEENTVILALQVLEKLDMIVTENGFFTIAGWEEYQSADKLAEIRAKDRERKRLKRAEAKALLESSVTIRGQSVDSPHIEEEIEEDKEKEKEYHSFTQAGESDLSNPESRRTYLGGIGKNVVFLSDEQMSDLLDKLSINEFDYYVGVIAEEELKGHRYKKKTHYQAILDMANKDRKII